MVFENGFFSGHLVNGGFGLAQNLLPG
jgi:hypothetical protein